MGKGGLGEVREGEGLSKKAVRGVDHRMWIVDWSHPKVSLKVKVLSRLDGHPTVYSVDKHCSTMDQR